MHCVTFVLSHNAGVFRAGRSAFFNRRLATFYGVTIVAGQEHTITIVVDVSPETPNVTTKPTCYDLTSQHTCTDTTPAIFVAAPYRKLPGQHDER